MKVVPYIVAPIARLQSEPTLAFCSNGGSSGSMSS